jgi:hypothetical protein
MFYCHSVAFVDIPVTQAATPYARFCIDQVRSHLLTKTGEWPRPKPCALPRPIEWHYTAEAARAEAPSFRAPLAHNHGLPQGSEEDDRSTIASLRLYELISRLIAEADHYLLQLETT